MGLFSRKARGQTPALLEGRHELCAVGESHCQDALLAIAGPKTSEAVCLNGIATLRCDPTNPYDANAVGVYIDDRRVAYLPREAAAVIAPRLAARGSECLVRAQINGGWSRGPKDEGSFGVVLYMPDPSDI